MFVLALFLFIAMSLCIGSKVQDSYLIHLCNITMITIVLLAEILSHHNYHFSFVVEALKNLSLRNLKFYNTVLSIVTM